MSSNHSQLIFLLQTALLSIHNDLMGSKILGIVFTVIGPVCIC